MPIMVPTAPDIPLRGFRIYADDIPALAQLVGESSTMSYWTDRSGRYATVEREERLTRADVAGFEIRGTNGSISVHRRTTMAGSKGTAVIRSLDPTTIGAVYAALEPRRAPWPPWRAYGCRFVRRTRAEQTVRLRWIVGIGITLALGVAGLVVAIT